MTASQPRALRLKFPDPALEQRFHRERLDAALIRVRWVLGLTLFVNVLYGATEWIAFANAPEMRHASLLVRAIAIPVVVGGLLAGTWTARLRAKLDYWLGVGVVFVMFGSVAIIATEMYVGLGLMPLGAALMLSSISFILICALVLPFRFSVLVAVCIAAAIGSPLLFWLCRPLYSWVTVTSVAGTHLFHYAAVLVAGYLRERIERREYAQRRELTRLNAELTRLVTEKSEFMAIAAHDLQAPLGAVRLRVESVAAKLPPAETLLRKNLDDAVASARRMVEIITTFLSAHAAESGQLKVQTARLETAHLLRAAADRHQPTAELKQQTLLARAPASLSVRADPGMSAQVLDNFVSNAIKFSPPGGQVELLAAPASPGRVRLAVRDSGPGLTPDDAARVFTRFARLSARPTAGEASVGLGLAVARRLAAEQGGTVGAENAPDGGAVFWIELPAA